ncbi:MAG: beta-lactamase family protein, partial [Akkermansiaceae bacterium]|nr:beta-lactamase family protein [Akkermansiaceae bacterium]
MRSAALLFSLSVLAVWMAGPVPVRAERAAGSEALTRIGPVVQRAIKRKKLPGGVFRLEHGDLIYQKAFGNRSSVPAREAMTEDTIFDLASLTKVVATTPCIMKLVENGRIRLDDKAQKFLPELTGDANKPRVTIRH